MRETAAAGPSPVLADPAYLKACCVDLWAHPGIRLLAGEALHPGGATLTERALDLLGLPPGSLLLDLGSGPGVARDLAAARGLRPVGVDLSPAWRLEDRRGWFACGDAERLSFRDGTFDGAVAECVLSVVPDKDAAAAELRRVVMPEGAVAVADVTLDGTLDGELATVAGWIACAAGALSARGYCALLEGAGFGQASVEDHQEALVQMIDQARRRVALLQGAVRTGLVDLEETGIPIGLLEVGQRLLGRAADAVRQGTLGYALITAGVCSARIPA